MEHLKNLVPKGLTLQFDAVLGYESNMSDLKSNIMKYNWDVEAVLAGAETGVELADELSSYLGVRTNGTLLSEARRNKYVMGETIRSAGIRAVRQLHATKWKEINDYIDDWKPSPFKVIVKPMDSAGSDDVTLCRSIDEVREAFGNIMGKTNVLGLLNEAVLVQEYLEGTEYVIDMVSRDGEHKVVAIWEYDRRAVNGASFVCFGQRCLTIDDPRVKELVAYQKRVCTALGILNGPSHGEVKWFQNEPVLIEVGSRCHGAEGFWMSVADAVYGYNQVNITLDSYIDNNAFDRIPSVPSLRLSQSYLLIQRIYDYYYYNYG